MSTSRLHLLAWLLAAAIGWGTLVPDAGAAAAKPAPGPAKTNAASATAKSPAKSPATLALPAKPQPVALPRSSFDLPKTPKDGRDPFFPDSTRLVAAPTTARTNAATNPNVINLALKAIAGAAGAQFATISLLGEGAAASVILAAGEESEFVTPTRRIRIRCLEIKTDAVVVEVAGQRRELRLRGGL